MLSIAAAVPVAPQSRDGAKEMLADLTQQLEAELGRRYRSGYQVRPGEVADSTEAAASLLDVEEPSDGEASVSSSLRLFRGRLSGAALSLEWESKSPDRVRISAERQSRLEAQSVPVLVGAPMVLGAVMGLLSFRFRLIGLVIGTAIGALVGVGARTLIARPILWLLEGGERATSERLAAELAALAARMIGTSPYATPAAPPAPARPAAPEMAEAAASPRPAPRASAFRRPPPPRP